MNNSTVETLIGAVVIVIAGAFLAFAYNTPGMGQKSAGYLITAEFDNVEGVNVGSDIRMAGIKIGTVTAQSLNPENFQAQITMSIDPCRATHRRHLRQSDLGRSAGLKIHFA